MSSRTGTRADARPETVAATNMPADITVMRRPVPSAE